MKGSFVVRRELAQMPETVFCRNRCNGCFPRISTQEFQSRSFETPYFYERLRPHSMALAKIAGDLFAALKATGAADNTVVVVMSDNGPMGQAMPESGYSQLVFRGVKGDTLEGGIRVNAYVRWPNVIKADTFAGDIVYCGDWYTTLATIAHADQHIPRDRVVDGVNQVSLLLNGDGYGRRDYHHVYEGPHLKATIKEQFKAHWPAPGSPGFALPVFDLYRDVKETKPLQAAGMWSVAYFPDMRERHLALKKKFPDREETRGNPYEGIADLRPETETLLEYYFSARKAAE